MVILGIIFIMFMVVLMMVTLNAIKVLADVIEKQGNNISSSIEDKATSINDSLEMSNELRKFQK